NLLEATLKSRVLSVKLPVIGGNLGRAVSFVTDLRNAVTGNLTVDQLVGANATTVLRQTLFSQLTDLGFLRDLNNDGAVNLNDVSVLTTASAVEFNLKLGGTAATTAGLNFDLGLPGLGLSLDSAAVTLQTSFAFNVSVGVDKTSGVYFKFNPSTLDD